MRPDLWRFLLVLGGAVCAGWLLGRPFAGALIGTLALMAWYYRALLGIVAYLRQGAEDRISDLPGVNNEIVREFESIREEFQHREEKLAEFLTRFQEAATALPDAIVILDEGAEIKWANSKAAEYLGVRWPQDTQQRILNLVRDPELAPVLESGDRPGTIEITSPGDRERQLAVMVVPYGRDQKLLVARDITTIHRMNQIRSDFVANVSHELRTPLTVISGYLETLSLDEQVCPEQWKPALSQMQGQARRMQALIEDLLLLSRLEQSDTPGEARTVNVPEMLNRIYQEAQLLSAERAHIFYLEVDQDLRLVGNEQEIYSAFSNIVFNAVRYTPSRGVVRIRWYHNAEGAHLEVRDSGVGIPPEHIPRLTERFYRVDKGRSRKQGGTGLGLAIVKHVLNRHRARLHIESEVGVGSLFRCDFPPESCLQGSGRPHRERSA